MSEQKVAFDRLALTVMDGLLELESQIARCVVPINGDAAAYVLRDLRNARDAVNLIRLDVRDG